MTDSITETDNVTENDTPEPDASLTSARERFNAGLYQEHLEEASFLYDQRIALADDPELSWRELAEYEQRFTNHIDALVSGNERALPVCRQQSAEGDAGELHAAIRVFSRCNRFDLLIETLQATDLDDDENQTAVRSALAEAFPESWRNNFQEIVESGNESLVPLIAYACGFRRFSFPGLLSSLYFNDTSGISRQHLFSAGRLRDSTAVPALTTILETSDDVALLYESARALLRLGAVRCIHILKKDLSEKPWAYPLTGLFGSRNDAELLHSLFTDTPSPDLITAIGFLGCSVSVPLLTAALKSEELSQNAAEALHLITGAELFEEYALPEDEVFDEFDNEQKENEDDTSATPAGEEPVVVTRISQQPEDWETWWSSNATHFNPEKRYRFGKPATPYSCRDTIASETISRRSRQLGYEELVVRYGIDVPFETEMSVAAQLNALDALDAAIRSAELSCRDGLWYYRGKECMGKYY